MRWELAAEQAGTGATSRKGSMTHRIYRVQSYEIVAPYTLRVRFDDATEQTINLAPLLAGEVYWPLRDPAVFDQVRIDPEVHTLVWPNGADFDPETLHAWPQRAQQFATLARQWKPKAASCRG
jgi:hypothetical protein